MRDPAFWIYGGLAFGFILAGHLVRAYKFKLLLQPVKDSGVRTQFQSLLIGYLFNTVLPLRLGEIVRAGVLGYSLKISSSLMFGLVLLERAVDGLIIGLFGLSLLALEVVPSGVAAPILTMCLILLAVAALLFTGIWFLFRRDQRLLHFWHGTTALFNTKVKNSLRYKLWSVIYGFHKLFRRRPLRTYSIWSVAMWGLYLAGIGCLSIYFFGYSFADNLVRSLTAYLGVSIPSGPAYLGSYQAVTNPIFQSLAPGANSLDWLVTSWLILAIPSSVIGALLLLRHHTNYSRLVAPGGTESRHDKLARVEDLSQEFDSFLDAFFSSNTLSHILHQLETKEDIKLIQYLKGGSDASVVLVHQNDKYLVKKIIPSQYASRLKAQHDWLKDYSGVGPIVNLTNSKETSSYYSIDLEYYPDYIPFFDYIHSQDQKHSKRILNDVFDLLFEHVYKTKAAKTNPEALDTYIRSKLWGKLSQATKINDELAQLRSYETLVINGVEYDNIELVMKRIRANQDIMHDLATYRESVIHGDVTVSNILASPKDHTFVLIDPAPDGNEIAGPVFDFGRQYQSLSYGYEFLCRDDSKVHASGNRISYEDSLSAQYRDLRDYFLTLAQARLTPEEFRAMRFHAAVLYSRVLAHRVHINPDNVAKFYAVSVRAFNDFLAQYDSPAKDRSGSSVDMLPTHAHKS
jgi:hypothetical protein